MITSYGRSLKEGGEALVLEELGLEVVVFFERGLGGRFWWEFATGWKVGGRI